MEPKKQLPVEPEKSRLEKVELELNKKDDQYFFRRRSRLVTQAPVTHEDWHDQSTQEPMQKKSSFAFRLFFLSALFFVGAVGFAFYKMQGGGNVVSDKNIDLTLTGPISVKGGDEVPLQLQIVNNNDVALEVSEIIVTYPTGARLADDLSHQASQVVEDVGDIEPHQVLNKSYRVVLFGEEKSTQDIKVELQYHLPGSGAIYKKTVAHEVAIDSAPIALTLSAPDSVTSGEETTLDVTVMSNTGKLIPSLKVKVNYPPGFIFTKATPAPITGTNNLWALGDVTASSTRDIIIVGTMTGQDNDTKAFQAIAGIGATDTSKDITLVYNSLFKKIALKKPFLGLSVALGDKTDDTGVAEGHASIVAILGWSNNTDMTLTNCSLASDFGGIIDRRSVKVDNFGNYFSSTNTAIWDPNSQNKFKVMSPGDTGSQTLSFASIPLVSNNITLKKSAVTVHSTFSCTKVGDDTTKDKQLTTVALRTIKINSDTQFNASARYFTGPFVNKGPFPPKGDVDTSYTIIWSLTNTSNDVQAAQVTAMLPPYTTWGDKSVGDGILVYDPLSRRVTWTVGTLKAGVGYDSPPKTMSFQLVVKPTLISVGSVVPIVSSATFTGTDDFTKALRQSIKDTLTTALESDPGLPKDVEGKVSN